MHILALEDLPRTSPGLDFHAGLDGHMSGAGMPKGTPVPTTSLSRWLEENPRDYLQSVARDGIPARRKGHKMTPFEKIAEWWAENMPSWEPLKVWKVQLRDASSPCSRGRVILVSFEREFSRMVGGIPEKPPVHPSCGISEVLVGHGFLARGRAGVLRDPAYAV